MTVTLPEITHYTYRVTWSAEDAEFVGTCLEFPSPVPGSRPPRTRPFTASATWCPRS